MSRAFEQFHDRPVPVEPDVGDCRFQPVGADLRSSFFEPLTVVELEQHVKDSGAHIEAAYARFQTSRDPADRAEAVRWMQLQNDAIRARNERIGGVRHAEFEQRLDDGVDFFNSRHALAMARGLE